MSGDGTTTPYQIISVGQLEVMLYSLSSKYQLANNINSDIIGYNTDAGFVPIGNWTVNFRGTFDGHESPGRDPVTLRVYLGGSSSF